MTLPASDLRQRDRREPREGTRFRCRHGAAGLALLVAFLASAGTAQAVEGLVLSEVFYDAEGSDAELEWVELFNGGDQRVGLSGWSLGWGGGDYSAGTLQLQGEIESGGYFVLGGPQGGPANGEPVFDWAVDLTPDLQNSGAVADGLALFALPAAAITAESVPDFAVIYGEENASGLLDASGAPGWVDVGDAPAGASLELLGDVGGVPAWQIQPVPNPGAGPLTVPEPLAAGRAAAALAALGSLACRRRDRSGSPARLRYAPAG